ncbi:hypothetical protein PUN28_019624 [Cardiocondyla obscurior]|uniref:Secreted protein n=1 Tax=Cardiocondyla obscurior TaxID=286306 RepID=A0AAW2EBK2_9HYME
MIFCHYVLLSLSASLSITYIRLHKYATVVSPSMLFLVKCYAFQCDKLIWRIALLQRLRELHRTGPAVAMERRDGKDEAVLSHVVSAPVAVRYHRPISGDHVVLRRHLRDNSHLYFKHCERHRSISALFNSGTLGDELLKRRDEKQHRE